MTKIIGPYLKSLTLILKTHKSIVFIGDQAEDAFNADFHLENDLGDSFVCRFLELLEMPDNFVLRHICQEQVLKYILDDNDEIQTIKTLLDLKRLYKEQPEYFKSVDTFLARNPEFEFIE